MLKKGQKVVVKIGKCKGVIAEISTWEKVLNSTYPNSTSAYFVRVPEWDNGTNGGRWLHETDLEKS